MRRGWILTGLVGWVACGGSVEVGAPDAAAAAPDAGGREPDSGAPGADAGSFRDAGAHDAGHGDAGFADSGSGDAGLSAGCGVVGSATGDFHLSALDGDGGTRDYEVLVPATYTSNVPLALTFVFHGAGGNEAGAKAFGLQNAPNATTNSIFVFPQGIPFQTYGVGWNDNCSGYDMVFFDHMRAALEQRYCIDTARVFAAGFSWGCDFVTALMCCRGTTIRAVGAASCTDEFGTASDYRTYNNLPCPVATHPAIRFTHDTNGDSAYPNPLFATTSTLYRSFQGCSSSSTPTSPAPCVAYGGCIEPFVECPYTGLGHALPSGWANDTWNFLSSFR